MENYKKGRHELKLCISYAQYMVLKNRLSYILTPDKNGGGNGYFIRSIYFDDEKKSFYQEKINGISHRKKYRLRAYNNSPDYITLECKEKMNSRIWKRIVVISKDTCEALIQKNYDVLLQYQEELCSEFYVLCHKMGFGPSVIVDYHREAFTYPASNVRVTFDKRLHAGGMKGFQMFTEEPHAEIGVPVYRNDSVILEIKYDEILPAIIREMIPTFTGTPLSISKYCLCLEKKMQISPYTFVN